MNDAREMEAGVHPSYVRHPLRLRPIVGRVLKIFFGVAYIFAHFACCLLCVAFRFLGWIIRHFSNALIDFALHLLPYSLDLVFIHGIAPFRRQHAGIHS